ncbi:MAG TPA: FAD-dependent thymidylate synthase, partial [Gemmataceae bacterium]|nr:FAD-dependent thymidylate synthase [Gemmataceae bacterium]
VQEFAVPEDGAISNPALLIALAGKRCYKSFEVNKALNPNITKIRKDYAVYFDNILSSGHGSVLEHSVYTYAFENVSRVFTAEMNRHRAGWAISEGSLRFIRFGDNIPYWEPECIRGPDGVIRYEQGGADKIVMDLLDLAARGQADQLTQYMQFLPDLLRADVNLLDVKKELSRHVFKHAFGHQESCYRILESLWKSELAETSKFAGKKAVTSMMRRVVGLGVASGGVWSGNIRALRHVITMRAAAEAEEEICHVFTRVAKMIRDREPLLFGDFAQSAGGFWTPQYRKV